jgi:Ser-tRNA(Ala) deacylase AlaX
MSTQSDEQAAERTRMEEEANNKIKELKEANAELVNKTESLNGRVTEEKESSKEVKKMEKQLKVIVCVCDVCAGGGGTHV